LAYIHISKRDLFIKLKKNIKYHTIVWGHLSKRIKNKIKMIQAEKIFATGLETTGLIGAD